MDAKAFIREVYLRSVPSVDLDLVPEDEIVDCTKHTLLISEYEKILAEFGVEAGTCLMSDCNMFILMSGPQLKEG